MLLLLLLPRGKRRSVSLQKRRRRRSVSLQKRRRRRSVSLQKRRWRRRSILLLLLLPPRGKRRRVLLQKRRRGRRRERQLLQRSVWLVVPSGDAVPCCRASFLPFLDSSSNQAASLFRLAAPTPLSTGFSGRCHECWKRGAAPADRKRISAPCPCWPPSPSSCCDARVRLSRG